MQMKLINFSILKKTKSYPKLEKSKKGIHTRSMWVQNAVHSVLVKNNMNKNMNVGKEKTSKNEWRNVLDGEAVTLEASFDEVI